MRRSYHKKRPKKTSITFRINEQINVPRITVIDVDGTHMGEMDTKEALTKAQEAGLDLVEVNPKANPPIVKIIDYGNLKYKKEKAQAKQKAKIKKVENKGVRLSPRISQHDRNVRYEQTKKFLNKGNRVTLELTLRGREHKHIDLAKELIQQFIDDLKKEADLNIRVEQFPKKQGHKINAIVSSTTTN